MPNIHVTARDGMGEVTEPSPGSFATSGMGEEDHMHFSTDFLSSGGVIHTDDFEVTERGAGANKSVDVAAGTCYVPNDSYVENGVSNTRFWRVVMDDIENVAISDNASGNPRIDIICVKIDTAAAPDEDSSNVATIVVVEGTPAGSPSVPATPANHLKLAEVAVANGFSSITDANITDTRVQAGLSPRKLYDESGNVVLTITPAGVVTLNSATGNLGLNAPSGLINFQQVVDSDVQTGCKVSKTGDQAIATASNVIITWDSEVFDVGGMHNNVTNNSRLTVPTGRGGKYLITCSLVFDPDTNFVRRIRILKNGALIESGQSSAGDNSALAIYLAVSTILELNAGDYIEFDVRHNKGSNMTLDLTSTASILKLF